MVLQEEAKGCAGRRVQGFGFKDIPPTMNDRMGRIVVLLCYMACLWVLLTLSSMALPPAACAKKGSGPVDAAQGAKSVRELNDGSQRQRVPEAVSAGWASDPAFGWLEQALGLTRVHMEQLCADLRESVVLDLLTPFREPDERYIQYYFLTWTSRATPHHFGFNVFKFQSG